MELTSKELATILHGLRLIQENANGPSDCTFGCCAHFDDCDALTDPQIDALCERINTAHISKSHKPRVIVATRPKSIQFDYSNQAWIQNGVYTPCGHDKPCDCFGTVHAGEPAREGADIQ